VGPPEKIKEAEAILSQMQIEDTSEDAAHFSISYFKFRKCPDGVCPSFLCLF
jgi:hypothetical protein